MLATVFQAVPPVLLGPRHAPRIAAGSEGKKAVPDGREEPWRQHAVGNRATSPPGARRKSGPGQMNSFHSESTTQERSVSSRKRSLDARGNFGRKRGLRRRAVRDRQDQHAGFSGLSGRPECCDDRARAVFLSLFASGQVLAVPQIAVTDDKTRNWAGQGHARAISARRRGRRIRPVLWRCAPPQPIPREDPR